MEMKITPEKKAEAIKMALNGINPLMYLQECGAKNPSATWSIIKNQLKKNDPDTFAKIPKFARKNGKADQDPEEEPEDLPVVPVTGPVVIDTPIPMTTAPVILDDFQVTAISNPELGEFYYNRSQNYIDWRNGYGKEVSLRPEMWKKLTEDLPNVLRILGVNLDK